jgi:hypothetical protein
MVFAVSSVVVCPCKRCRNSSLLARSPAPPFCVTSNETPRNAFVGPEAFHCQPKQACSTNPMMLSWLERFLSPNVPLPCYSVVHDYRS